MASTIHTNAPVNICFYLVDDDDNPIEIEPGSTYKCSIKENADDALPILTFVSGGASGEGTIDILTDEIDGVSRDVFALSTDDSMADVVAALIPGAYKADLVRTDDDFWEFGFEVEVVAGITVP